MVVAGWGGAVEARLVVLGQPVREELLDGIGLDNSAGEDVGSDLTGLLEEQDTEVLISGFVRKLFEANSGGETCGACMDGKGWLDTLELYERADDRGKVVEIGVAPPPTIHTST